MIALQRIANRGIPTMAVAAFREIQAGMLRLAGYHNIKRKIHDYEMVLDLYDPGISRALNLYRERELDMKYMLEQYITPGMTVFDIGANIGYYPLLERSLGAEVISIEPDPNNLLLLALNVRGPVIRAAVSDRVSTRTFHTSKFSNLGTFHPVQRSFVDGATTEVETTTIMELAKAWGKPDLIRMDIEGHEVEVLSTLDRDLMPIVIFETHHDRYTPRHDMSKVMRYLFDIGYRVPMISSAHPTATKRFFLSGCEEGETIRTDATYRTIFRNIAPSTAIDAICGLGGARTVVLTP